MRTYKWVSLALAIVLMVSAVVACGTEKEFDEQLASQLQAVLDDAVESPETPFPGALLYVSGPELGTWSGATGLGNIETDTAMRADDMYPACSIVKIFVSVATLQLVEEGLFALDDTLTTLLPENVTARFANSNRITVRMLLNHTSGHGNWQDTIYGEAMANPAKVWERDEILDLSVARQDPDFALGESWSYSNTGYFLLELIIEQATGRSYREEIRERIINKLNMENTVMPEPGDPSYPGNYFHSYLPFEGEIVDFSDVDASIGRELVSTAADLARFLDAVMSGKLFQNSETLDEMLTVVEVPEGAVPWGEASSYGLGIIKIVFPGGIEMFGHLGDNPDSTFVYHLPAQDITISGAANTMDPIGLYYQILCPALEILVPGFEMPVRTEKEFDEQLASQLQASLEDAVESQETVFPGALLRVSSPELGTWSGAAGLADVEAATPMRPDNQFRGGSLTKPFVSAVVLQLVEEERFSLDDPMTSVLPESVTARFANSNQITVRMLLNHTGGMPEFLDLAMPHIIANPQRVWEDDEWLEFAAAQEPWFAPGEAQGYSNTDYILLGLVIEQATGQSWREEVRERIIEPLNLENTLLPEPGDISSPPNQAHGYNNLGAGLVDMTELGVDPSMAGASGGQALVTTAADLALFLKALLAGELFQNAGTLEVMQTFVPWPDGYPLSPWVTGYGLGLMKVEYPGGIVAIGHSGGSADFYSFVFYLPDQGITISGMANFPDGIACFSRLIPLALEILVPGFEMPVRDEDAETRAALQGLIDQQVQEQDILGMVMAVRLADGAVIGAGSGYSDPSGEEAWSVDTVSALGSVTKTFTAVVVMQLVEEGKLSLDDTIDTWFPEQPNGDRITIGMLLSHTSGLANYISGENVMEGRWNREWAPMDLVAEANKLQPAGEPGSSDAHYSNTNYILLGLIVEEVTGNSWAQEVESRIIEPLDLKDTTFLSNENIQDIMVAGYAKTEDGYISSLELPWYPHPSTVWSAGGVVSTLSDLMTFASALFDGKLVSKETLAVMAQPMGTDVDTGRIWGLGGATLDMGGLRAFGMGGDIPGYHAFFVGFLDNKFAVVALCNTEEGDVINPGISALQYISQ